jgi:uncharacterized membrane protein YqjE
MPEAPRREGVFESLRGGAATLLALARVRLDLFATELQEEKNRAGLVLLYGAGAVLFLSFGLFFLAAAITVLLWESNRLLALGVCTAIFLTCGVFFALTARRHASPDTAPFAESIAELKRDVAALKRET